MKIGISSFTYGWNVGVENAMPSRPMTEIDLINKAIEFRLDCLQIGDNLPMHTFSEMQNATFKKRLEDYKIGLEIGAKKLTLDHLQNYIKLCIFYKSPLLRFVIDDKDYQPSIEQTIEIIKTALPILEQHNISLGIENHDRFKAQELVHIMQEINHKNVGICLDCVNSIGAGEGLEHVATLLAPYTINLHVKDFKTSRLQHKMGFIIEGEIAGKGMTNLPWLLSKMQAFGRCRSAILEQWVSPENEIEATCKKEIEWAEIGVKYLKENIKN